MISLVSYEPTDPVWFFSTGAHAAPVNFAGRVGAFLAELSFQLFGYASFLAPAIVMVLGWHYFWCRMLDAAYTKLIGSVLLFGCVSALLSVSRLIYWALTKLGSTHLWVIRMLSA